MSYYHLTTENRKSIERYYQKGLSITKIAEMIGVHKSTISREFKRNPSRDYGYNAIGAQRKANKRRKNSINKPKLLLDSIAFNIVSERLNLYYSPEQISNTIPKKHYVCTTTIYRAIKNKLFKKETEEKMRRYYKKFKNKGAIPINVGNSAIKNINTRPKSIENRNRIGHWELDTIVLRDECNCHLATFVERKSRYVIIKKISNKTSKTMSDVIIEAFKDMPLTQRRTLTVDNGMEFSDWRKIEEQLSGTKVYYCDPYSPWQRGSNENTNGLIRQFFPRKKILTYITDDFVKLVQDIINFRPRKCLNWKCPNNVFCCI